MDFIPPRFIQPLRNIFNKKSTRLLGLGIGSSSVKILELSKTNHHYCVEHYAVVPIEQSIPDAIQQALVLSGTTLRSVAMSMPDLDVISKIIQMEPNLSMDEREEIILANGEQHIPYPLHEVSLDFEILGPSSKNQQLVDVLLIAARSAQVNERMALARAAGLTVHVVDVQSHALERACRLLQTHNTINHLEKTLMIIDIGHHAINVIVLYKNNMIFSRVESYDKEPLNNISIDHMERCKTILMHIERAFHFFCSSACYQEVNIMLLAGGGSYTPDICPLLETQIGIPTALANPFINMSIGPNVSSSHLTQHARLMMTSCGLALRSFHV